MRFPKKIPTYSLWIISIAFSLAMIEGVFREPELKSLTTNVDVKNKIINDTTPPASIFTINPNFLGAYDTAFQLATVALTSAVSPAVTYSRITPGMRKEEIAEIFQKKLSWSERDKEKFIEIELPNEDVIKNEGFFYPGIYVIPEDGTPKDMATMMIARFNNEIVSKYASSTKKEISLDTTLKIASIIEREASSAKEDMRLVSGVIWNRLFKGMNLDMDTTLQYAKGNEETGWWPKVVPDDKYIDSDYNTYKNPGLPPTAISNPNLASIDAALNPRKTDFLFFIHDKFGRFHGARNYKEHVENIRIYYK